MTSESHTMMSRGATARSVYRPQITFQDTNVVGNVYFLSFFRWQAEARDAWLRTQHADLWRSLRAWPSPLLDTHWTTRFEDPFGATLGDKVAVTLTIDETTSGRLLVTSEITRETADGSIRIASASSELAGQAEVAPPLNDHPLGPCYTFAVVAPAQPTTLDLLSWQGKCREMFLADHAPETLHGVALRRLLLQTTTASLDVWALPEALDDQLRVEMRLESLKCGQMGVRFDYFADHADGTAKRFAKGNQRMSSKHQRDLRVTPCPFPADLLLALRNFTESEQLLGKINDILCFSSAQ